MDDNEQYNRLFILGGRGCSEDDWRSAFEKYGNISEVQLVLDRKTGDQKGIVYITYEKISEAAKALEEMNGRYLPNHPKPLKVMIASSKREGNVKDPKEDEKMLRLFVMCDKKASDQDLKDDFKTYGEIEYVRVIKDRRTGESKGLAYIKYFRPYHAALAYEQCDPKYKARFAQAKTERREQSRQPMSMEYESVGWGGRGDTDSSYNYNVRASSSFGSSYSSSSYNNHTRMDTSGPGYASSTPMELLRPYPAAGADCRLEATFTAGAAITADQVYKLFDLVPGLEYCDYDRNTGMAYVKYTSPQCTQYAKDKMSSLEFPPGSHISLQFPASYVGGYGDASVHSSISDLSQNMNNFSTGGATNVNENLGTLVESIKKATEVLEKAGLGGVLGAAGMQTGGTVASAGVAMATANGEERVRWCNVPLPVRLPLEAKDSIVEERLFVVAQPESFPDHVLVDLLCRFGSLIDAYFMPGKNFGYAKFAKLENAQKAQEILHGQTVCNMRIKLIHADPPKFEDDEKSKKRPRT